MSVYRSHHADDGQWHEIVGESGEAGEGCLMTAIKATAWALLAGFVVGVIAAGSFYGAFRLDMW